MTFNCSLLSVKIQNSNIQNKIKVELLCRALKDQALWRDDVQSLKTRPIKFTLFIKNERVVAYTKSVFSITSGHREVVVLTFHQI